MINFKKLFNVVNKYNINQALQNLFIKGGFVFGTDGYKAIKYKLPEIEGANYDDIDGHIITPLNATVTDFEQKEAKQPLIPKTTVVEDELIQFPDVAAVFPKGQPVYEVNFFRRDLTRLLNTMQRPKGDSDMVTIKFFGPNIPVLFKNKNMEAVLSSIKKEEE